MFAVKIETELGDSCWFVAGDSAHCGIVKEIDVTATYPATQTIYRGSSTAFGTSLRSVNQNKIARNKAGLLEKL